MNPQPSQVAVARPLTNVMVSWKNPLVELANIFKVVTVKTEQGKVFAFDNPDYYRDEAEIREIGGEAKSGGVKMGTQIDINIDEVPFKVPVYDRIRDNSEVPIKEDISATKRATGKVDLKRETTIAALLATATNWSYGTVAPSTKWDAANSDPLGDLDTLLDSIQQKILTWPTDVALGANVWKVIKRHPQIIDLIKSTAANKPAIVTKENFAALIEVKKVHVIYGMKVTSVEGASTVTRARIFSDGTNDDNVWAGYVANAPSLSEPSAGYTFEMSKSNKIVTWRDDSFARSWIEARKFFQCKVMSDLCGGCISTVLT